MGCKYCSGRGQATDGEPYTGLLALRNTSASPAEPKCASAPRGRRGHGDGEKALH